MKTRINQFVTIFFLLITFNVFSQRILVVEQPGTIINKKYTTGSFISIKTTSGLRLKGHINYISDSTVVINYITVNNSDIKYVFTNRRLVNMVSRAGIEGGLAYIGIDVLNGLINNYKPIITIGGIMFAGGLLLKLVDHRRLHVNNKAWRITVLDFSILKDPGVYDQIRESE